MNSELKPKIRFKGFTDDWEQRKLNNMCSIITKQTGFDYSATIKPSLVEHRIPNSYSFIQNKDFEGLYINLNTDFYIPKSVADQFPKITLDTPSLLISISGKIGNVGFYSLKNKAFIGGAVGICKLLNPDDGILSTYELESDYGQKYFQSLIKASSHANITVEDIRNIELILPINSKERSMISKFLLDLDNLITLHQRKCDKLIELKKSLLKKMFPQNNSVIPEIRFKGFTDDWEQRKFDEVVVRISTGLNPRDNFTLNNGGKNYYVTIKNFTHGHLMLDSNCDMVDDIALATIQRRSDLQKDDILFTSIGRIGDCYLIENKPKNWNINESVFTFRPNKKIVEPEYLFHTIHSDSVLNQIMNNITGSTFKSIKIADLKNADIPVTTKSEQIKLSKIISNIDNLITLHQRKHDKLNKIKQSLLNDMFV